MPKNRDDHRMSLQKINMGLSARTLLDCFGMVDTVTVNVLSHEFSAGSLDQFEKDVLNIEAGMRFTVVVLRPPETLFKKENIIIFFSDSAC